MVDFFGPLALLVAFGIAGILISVRLRLPPVLGLLVAGMLCGPFVFGFIDGGAGIKGANFELMEQIGEVGAILLLFTLGIEFSLSKLLKGGLRIFLVFVAKIALVFGVGYVCTLLLGLTATEALFIGVILSITSTAFFARVLTQQGLYKRTEVPLLVGVLILEDIYAVIALAFLSQVTGAGDLAAGWLVLRFVLGGVVLFLLYFGITKILPRLLRWMHSYHSEENVAFVSMALCFGLAAVSGALGLAPTAGAFLAGSAIAGLPTAKKFERSIHPFTLLFVSLFFLSMGLHVDPAAIFASAWIIFALTVVTVITHVAGIAIPSYLFTGMNARNALFAGVAMIPVGEFSLLIAREAPAGGLDLVSITSGVLFLSVLIMSLLVKRSEEIADRVRVPETLSSFMTYLAFRISGTLTALEPGGAIHSEFARRRSAFVRDSLVLGGLGIFAFGYLLVVEPRLVASFPGADAFRAVPLIVFGVMIVIVLKRLKDLLDLFSRTLMEDSPDTPLERRLFRSGVIGVLLVVAGLFVVPTIVNYLVLPAGYHALALIPLFLAVVVLFSFARSTGALYRRSERRARFVKRMRHFRDEWKREVEIGYDEATSLRKL